MVFGGMSKNNGGCLKINLRWPLFQSFRFKFSVIKEFILSDSFSRIKKLSKRLLLQDWVLWPSDQTQFPFSSVHEDGTSWNVCCSCGFQIQPPHPEVADSDFSDFPQRVTFYVPFPWFLSGDLPVQSFQNDFYGNGILTDIPCNSEPGILIWSVHHFFYRYKRGYPIFILR